MPALHADSAVQDDGRNYDLVPTDYKEKKKPGGKKKKKGEKKK